MGYNHDMFRQRRREAPLVAVLSVVLVLSILLPVSPWRTPERRYDNSVLLQSPHELLVAGAPFSIDCDLALFSSGALQGKLQITNRPQQAITPPRLDVVPVTCFESPSARHIPKLFWWKNRRYICQVLDIPPPLSTPPCAL